MLAVNPALEQTLGRHPDPLLGRGHLALIHPNDRGYAQTRSDLVLAGETFIGEHRHRLIGCRCDSCARSQHLELAPKVSIAQATDSP